MRYRTGGITAGRTAAGAPVLVRYADDLAVCCYSQQQAEQVKVRLAQWLTPSGLSFNQDKTRIVHVESDGGFDFLGVTIRRYRQHGPRPSKLLITPSRDAVKRIRKRLALEMRGLRGSNAAAVIARLNPIIRGWAAYYRPVVSSRVFAALNHYVWWLTFRWACRTHPRKPRRWIARRYFGTFNKFRNDRWVFGDRDHRSSGGGVPHLVRFAWTNIVRHQLVTGSASPDDPELRDYWVARRRKVKPALDSYNLHLLTQQDGRCPLCGDPVLSADQPPESPEEWERWWLATIRRAIAADHLTHHGQPDGTRTRLVHTACHRSLRARQRRGTTVSA
ncbi:group II intron maturase-specific domain-containing protein [Nocardia sp. NPDC052112]|uniref:group II intron maturase-specific domain-containing protein n=1 Tax=Nocardia sp. NPDC052112 TaxID=3155646 RepID=UPI003418DC54